MSDFDVPLTPRKATKRHRCMSCGEGILIGEIYSHQRGVYDCLFYESKMHPECAQYLSDTDDGGGDFVLYSNDRPSKTN